MTIEVNDEALLAEAARLAAQEHASLSEFVARAIGESIERHRFRESLQPATRRWAGALPPMSDDEVAAALRSRRERKYGP